MNADDILAQNERLECLKLAVSLTAVGSASPETVVAMAGAFFAFVEGLSTPTPPAKS
jgi:hypothetical protein